MLVGSAIICKIDKFSSIFLRQIQHNAPLITLYYEREREREREINRERELEKERVILHPARGWEIDMFHTSMLDLCCAFIDP